MSVNISDIAAKQIAQILAEQPGKTALRISVEGGGCSGFSYKYDLVSEIKEDDFVIKKDGAVVFIDSISFPFMEGAEIDFVDDLMGQSFQIHNPNATSSCGCGVSFSI
ncbi:MULTISPECIES: iron-sulfur cluster insertion protein ErpA [unclassified Bartonella]|uniref:iron-sulfur cluster insertion protein ErpA n=1 Tax=unclassified Bartonella TaxID=2645622 RepID=UPI00099A0C65|nr:MULTISPECIES: iron-sulfur cluster insertion protein ErpA [unclassified Bartonella]AQX18440.1 Iron-sulfur cluster assembly accessory protein [Bartonella sp. A1379B]AQX22953.1 Iron-sulfur cluster assembly accessory protein [Bartonella sp. 11B]AQX23752.1 Iron-sulfur cluster assembly accessory protein [Bartonella sp. 114]AQX25406.1 Iron-sulfur cluster assembly accessory protein [Bartonella sp. Coyote22sub2]